MPITHFNFQFEKEGARRIALAEQPRPERSVLATMLYIHGSHFSMLSPSVLSMGKIVVGRKIGGESATSPPSLSLLHSLQSRPKKRAQERAIRASYGLWSSFNSGLVLLVALFNYELLITNYLFTSLQGKGFSGT